MSTILGILSTLGQLSNETSRSLSVSLRLPFSRLLCMPPISPFSQIQSELCCKLLSSPTLGALGFLDTDRLPMFESTPIPFRPSQVKPLTPNSVLL